MRYNELEDHILWILENSVFLGIHPNYGPYSVIIKRGSKIWNFQIDKWRFKRIETREIRF